MVHLNDAFTRRLGVYALSGETAAQHFSKGVLPAYLHLGFLTTLYPSFAFPASAITKLGGILTQVKNSFANLKVGFEYEDQTFTIGIY
ncbi:hypothetical protein [Rufibacter sp. LB8]|uniref:hypothetical protein n=1 Tax=Rufibacter sp. LB8 TaxID=2777781 RepID=UPI001CEFA673|nr:hypothetical protein [Rufibacter sp. LB8]